jgi:hypothetical protein
LNSLAKALVYRRHPVAPTANKPRRLVSRIPKAHEFLTRVCKIGRKINCRPPIERRGKETWSKTPEQMY